MEVMTGYKQTEVGVIPEDWEVSTIGDEFSIQLGKMLDSEKNIGTPKPYIGNRSVQWGRIELSDIGFIKMTQSDLQRFRLRDGDLLVCEGGEIGRAAIWKEQMPECYYQKALHRLRSKRGYRADLLLWTLERWSGTGFLANFVTQTSIAHLPKDKFEKVPLPLPTRAEQDAIAEVLSKADALIECLERLIAKKRLLKRGVMQELLTGRRRLRGFADATTGYKQTEVGAVPEDWKLWALADLGAWKGGATPSMRNSMFWANGSIPWASSGDIKSILISDTPMKITENAIKQSSTTLIPANSILIVTRSGILRRYLPVAKNTVPIAINQDIKALITSDNVVADFVLHQMISNGGRILGACLKSGTTVESIEFSWLKAFKIPLPSTKAEQEAIAEVLNAMDAEIALLEAQLAKYRQIKQGLMQNLLTGRIRLV